MNGVEPAPLVNLQEIAEIELFILRRMKEYTLGDHASVFKGSGFNFVGSRDWQPGDRMSHIDWAQSSMTNFSPLVTREFEQDSTATVLVVADASLSTRCGAHSRTIAYSSPFSANSWQTRRRTRSRKTRPRRSWESSARS